MITFSSQVQKDWVDYNGHLRDAFYLLLFSYATDSLMERIGLNEEDREASGHSLFTLECHLNFLQEVKLGQTVEVRTQIIAHDQKRVHLYHALYEPQGSTALAASEQMLLHVDMAGPKSAPFSQLSLVQLAEIVQQQEGMPVPEYVGRVMGLPAARK